MNNDSVFILTRATIAVLGLSIGGNVHTLACSHDSRPEFSSSNHEMFYHSSPTCMWHADGNFYAFEGIKISCT